MQMLEAITRQGVLYAASVRYWRGCKQLKAEDLGIDPSHVDERLIRLGHKRLVPKEALAPFALIEGRVHAAIEAASFPFLGGIARFVPNTRLEEVTRGIEKLRDEFRDATLAFVADYSPMRENALNEWREAARHLNGSAARLLATIEASFPPAGEIAAKFNFETRVFQVAVPDSLRLEVASSVEQQTIMDARRRVAEDATRRMQADLDGFVRESVTALREEAARIAGEVLATIDSSENGVHQRTLNRLTTFIDQFKTLNFAADTQLEATLERFRRDILSRSAEDYRNNPGAMGNLTEGLSRLRESAVQLAANDARDVVARFGQLGVRKFAIAG